MKERAIGYAVMEIGTMIGSIWASAMAGYLAEHGFAGGWPSTFYVSGVIAIASALAWAPCVTSTPEEHWSISVTEMKHIRKQSGVTDIQTGGGEGERGRRQVRKRGRAVPWKAILTNKAVLANIFSKFFLRWTFYTLIMKLPTYLVCVCVDVSVLLPLSFFHAIDPDILSLLLPLLSLFHTLTYRTMYST